ncbi:MAG: chromosome condensation regulator [Verrucomicrobiales bacterium]|nr:chromosome condensation regulator [Verrucomicrobiales bacterium]
MPPLSSAVLIIFLLTASLSRLAAVAPAVAAGDGFTLLLKADGTVLATGVNQSGQLGDGTATGHGTPQPVAGLSGVQAMAAGASHSLFLKTDGTVWAAGRNYSGQLGDGTGINRSSAQPVTGLTGVRAIAAGDYHSLFLKTDGTVWVAGLNESGQLGDGTTTARFTPVRVMEGIKAIAAGAKSSFFLKMNGTVRAAGENASGQLGDGTVKNRPVPAPVKALGSTQELTGVASVSAGGAHTFFLKSDGAVFATGLNVYGELSDGSMVNRATPVPVRTGGVRSVTAGRNCTFFLGTDGVLTGVGYNVVGQLGDGTETNRPEPVVLMTSVASVAAGGGHTCFLKTDGTVLATGDNYNGQLGDGRMGYSTVPVPVPGLAAGVQAVSAGQWCSLFLKTDGTVLGTGLNFSGQLGDGSDINRRSPVPCAINGVNRISAGYSVSIFIKTDGSVHFSGGNLFSRFGGSYTRPVALPAVGACWMASSGEHVLFLQSARTVAAAGNNFMGQLGDGTGEYRQSLVQAAGVSGAVGVAAGWDHSLFLLGNGTVMACGRNTQGQLGGYYDSDWDGWSYTSRLSPLPVQGLSGITAVAAGGWHSFFLKGDGTVLAAGFNGTGQLGDGTSIDRSTPVPVSGLRNVQAVAAGHDHSLFLKQDGTVWAVGGNFSGQLGDGTTTIRLLPVPVAGLRDIQAVAAGDGVSFFLTKSGAVLVSGTNFNGAAGLGSQDRSAPVEVLNLGQDPGASWQREQFGALATDPAVSGWLADPDRDGVVNLLERAFNLPALQSGRPVLTPGAGNEEEGRAGLPWVTLVSKPQGPVLAVHYVRLKTKLGAEAHGGLVYTPEFCTAPDGGSGGGEGGGWTAATGPEMVVSIDDHWERVTVEDTGGGGARFARVRVGGRG